jgi:hypothetical protein
MSYCIMVSSPWDVRHRSGMFDLQSRQLCSKHAVHFVLSHFDSSELPVQQKKNRGPVLESEFEYARAFQL